MTRGCLRLCSLHATCAARRVAYLSWDIRIVYLLVFLLSSDDIQSASIAGVSGCNLMRWPSQLGCRFCMLLLRLLSFGVYSSMLHLRHNYIWYNYNCVADFFYQKFPSVIEGICSKNCSAVDVLWA